MSSKSPEKSFAALFEEANRGARRRGRPGVGDAFDVVVVQIGKDAVFVEFEAHHQGWIEAVDLRAADGTLEVAVGNSMRARVVEVDSERGIRFVPTPESPVAAGAAVGQVVSGEVHRVENYGVFLQIEGTK